MTVARCSQCKYYKEDYTPQPGASWDRCTAVKIYNNFDVYNDDGYCMRNEENNCKEFKRSLISYITPAAKVLWWKPYM